MTDTSRLLVFSRTVNGSFEIQKDSLELVSFHGTAEKRYFFSAVESRLNEHGGFQGFAKLSVVIEGAPARKRNTLLRKACIIYTTKALCYWRTISGLIQMLCASSAA